VRSHPSGDALADAQLQAIHLSGVGIFGRAQDEILVFEHVHEARITFDERHCTGNYLLENFVKRVGSSHTAANFVEKIYLRAAMYGMRIVHVKTYRHRAAQSNRNFRCEE
jgi:hypothetical protein